MTIAAGLVCSDGIVVCADTQLTSNYKQPGRKLWLYSDGKLNVAVTGAGDYVLLKLASEHVRRRIKAGMTVNDVRHAVIEPILASIHEDHIDRAPDWKVHSGFDLTMLAAVQTPQELKLYETSRTSVAEVETYRCVGSGDPVANHIAGTMFSGALSVIWGQVVAAYMIQQTKAFGHDCGGDTQVVVFPRGEPARELKADKIALLERVGTRIHEAMGALLLDMADTEGRDYRGSYKALWGAVNNSRNVVMLDHISETLVRRNAASENRAKSQALKSPKRGRKRQPPSRA